MFLGIDYIKVLCRIYKFRLFDFCSKSQIFSNILLNLRVMICLGEYCVDPNCRLAPAVSDVTLSMVTEIEFENRIFPLLLEPGVLNHNLAASDQLVNFLLICIGWCLCVSVCKSVNKNICRRICSYTVSILHLHATEYWIDEVHFLALEESKSEARGS